MEAEMKTKQGSLESKTEANNTKLGVLQENVWTSEEDMKTFVSRTHAWPDGLKDCRDRPGAKGSQH
jgi:hypothetical protein